MRLAPALPIVVALVASCSSSPPASSTPVLPDGCAAMLPTCLADQKICVAGPACAACDQGQYAASDGTCATLGDATVHDFAQFTANPGQEILGLCQSWTLDNATELWVNAVELDQDEASHHSNWLFVPDDKYPGPDGVWSCADRNYDQLTAALAGGVLYAQSTQAKHEVQKFPNGAAVRIPPYSRIISDVHILNTTKSAVTGHARLGLYTLAAADVKVKLAPFHLVFNTLDVPARAQSRSKASCNIADGFQSWVNQPLAAKIYYILPHYHALGRHFFVDVLGGPNDGQSIFDATGASGEARGRALNPPVDLTGAQGLTFGCDFENSTDSDVHYGFGDQEMCELLGFADSSVAWESTIDNVAADPTATDMSTYTGACSTLAFKYSFTRGGGPIPDAGP